MSLEKTIRYLYEENNSFDEIKDKVNSWIHSGSKTSKELDEQAELLGIGKTGMIDILDELVEEHKIRKRKVPGKKDEVTYS